MRDAWHAEIAKETPDVTEEDIAQVVSMWTGIPVIRISAEESERLLRMEEALHKRVVGQQEAISAIARAIRRSRLGIARGQRPIGSFLFLGPSGVGKTEAARQLARFLFQSEKALVRFDICILQFASLSKAWTAPE